MFAVAKEPLPMAILPVPRAMDSSPRAMDLSPSAKDVKPTAVAPLADALAVEPTAVPWVVATVFAPKAVASEMAVSFS